jgi:hypothetical protein
MDRFLRDQERAGGVILIGTTLQLLAAIFSTG